MIRERHEPQSTHRTRLRAVLAAIDALADDPRPPGSVPWGSTLARLHTGRYRILYEITEDAVLVRHVARLPATS